MEFFRVITGKKGFNTGMCYSNMDRDGVPSTKHMSANATDDTERNAVDTEDERYGELNIGDEEFVVYDRKNHEAWVQSTVAVSVEEMQ